MRKTSRFFLFCLSCLLLCSSCGNRSSSYVSKIESPFYFGIGELFSNDPYGSAMVSSVRVQDKSLIVSMEIANYPSGTEEFGFFLYQLTNENNVFLDIEKTDAANVWYWKLIAFGGLSGEVDLVFTGFQNLDSQVYLIDFGYAKEGYDAVFFRFFKTEIIF